MWWCEVWMILLGFMSQKVCAYDRVQTQVDLNIENILLVCEITYLKMFIVFTVHIIIDIICMYIE